MAKAIKRDKRIHDCKLWFQEWVIELKETWVLMSIPAILITVKIILDSSGVLK